MAHSHKPEADALLDKEFKVLDHGFVRLVDYMGTDESIVQAARVSYGKGTKKISEDRGLIRYLMKNMHTSPFEMVEFKFHIKLPIFVARQWIRHRTANVNEYSGRYSVMPEEFYLPRQEDICFQAIDNKQGRSEKAIPPELQKEFIAYLKKSQKDTFEGYSRFIEAGLAREIARINLPLAIYTEWYWKIDLHNLFHFLKLRLDKHAQREIRAYAETMAEIVKTVCPMAYEAFMDYRINTLSFSGPELKFLHKTLKTTNLKLKYLTDMGLSQRDAVEFLEKIETIKKQKK
ncbi:MAG: FAD-dependent thymidylate synthase [candidate division Zixibacteria bacterium]|nr:FAD-dependent thymidylate synthase [candidate division Zixibacteria bacterium]MDD5426527.1 FAD-dependent thymidylate synthase [candidate division Zixibacteria bacterium]